MKKYKHKEDGYEVEAEKLGADQYIVRNYRVGAVRSLTDPVFARNDFERLFEPVPEYCCDWFAKCVENNIIRRFARGAVPYTWFWDALGETLIRCPFCKRMF